MCHFVACAAHCAKCEGFRTRTCDADGCHPGYYHVSSTTLCEGACIGGKVVTALHMLKVVRNVLC